jgi:hypothetical protein
VYFNKKSLQGYMIGIGNFTEIENIEVFLRTGSVLEDDLVLFMVENCIRSAIKIVQ